jgi:hypothetical protein
MPACSRFAQPQQALGLVDALEARQLGGLAEADDQRHREGARAHAALVAAAVDDRVDAHPRLAAHPQRADALGAVHLVRRQRRQVELHRKDVALDLAGRLHHVGVDQRLGVLGLHRAGDLGHRLHDADLVVGEHDAHQDRLVGDRVGDLRRGDQAVGGRRQVRDREAVALEALAGVERRLVLGLDGDDVLARLAVVRGDALDGQVDRLGRARGDDDLLGVAADQRGDLAAGGLDGGLGGPAEHVVAAGGVAEVLGEVRQHRLEHARIDRRRRVVVHEDGQLHRRRRRDEAAERGGRGRDVGGHDSPSCAGP